MVDSKQTKRQLLDEVQTLRVQNDELQQQLLDCREKLHATKAGGAASTSMSAQVKTTLGDVKLFQMAFESAACGMALIDPEGRFLKVNHALCELVGRSEEEMLDLGFQQINHPDDLEAGMLGWQRMIAGETDMFQDEKRLLHASGAVKWVHVHVAIARDEQREPVCFVAQVQDITSRKQAERQLRLTQFTVDSSSTPILWARPDASFVYVNDAALRQSGYTREEMLSMTVHDLNPDFTVQYWSGWLKNLKRDESLTFETRHLNKDGSIMPVEVTVNLLRFEGEEYLFAFVTEITERKQREAERELAVEALQKSEHRYRHVVEDQVDFVVRWLPKGVRTFANQPYCDYFGQSPEQIVGTSFYPLVAKEDLDSVRRRVESLSVDDPVSIGENRVVRPDGTIAWNEWTIRAIFDTHGQLIEYQSVGRDITFRKKMEQTAREAIVATARLSLLSNRERDVLELVVAGKANKVTAQRLHIAEGTVEKHRASVMRKLHATSAAELVRLALIAEQSEAID
jgi:PAS domain S-box-containing protein